MADVPITFGQGQASIAAETIGTHTYQVIKVVGGETGSTSVLGVNPDRSINVSVLGVPNVFIAGGSVAALASGNQSVSGAVTAPPGSVMTVNQLAGSVMAVSGTFTPAANQSVSGAITFPAGSIATVTFPAGSVTAVTFAPAANQSVSGAVTAPPGSVMTVATLAGSVMAISGTVTAPAGSVLTIVHPAGSVTAVAGATTTTAGSVISSAAPAGSVMAVRTDTASVITTQLPGSIMAVSGTFVTPAASIQSVANPAGSVTAVRTDLASVITVTTVVGSVISYLQAPSLVGTYAEDAPSASGDKGFLVMGARNDTLASVTSADGDYSSHVVGPSGELIIANAPITKWINGQTSVMYGTSVQVIAAAGTSIFNYLSAMQVANDSATFSRVKVTGGLGSVLAWTVAPANGGSNIVFTNPIKTGENSGISVSISGVSSVYVTMEGFTAKI